TKRCGVMCSEETADVPPLRGLCARDAGSTPATVAPRWDAMSQPPAYLSTPAGKVRHAVRCARGEEEKILRGEVGHPMRLAETRACAEACWVAALACLLRPWP